MDENTWHFAQFIMWAIGIQTTILLAILGGIWSSILNLNKKYEKLDEKLTGTEKRLDERITGVEKRLIAIETILHMKDCYLLKDERLHKEKAE